MHRTVSRMWMKARVWPPVPHRQRVPDGRLHQEPVQHGAVVAVAVEPVDEPLVPGGLVSLRAPDNALVQVGDPEPVVGGIEREQQLVKGLGQVVTEPGLAGWRRIPPSSLSGWAPSPSGIPGEGALPDQP
jgi:hypothetical protein